MALVIASDEVKPKFLKSAQLLLVTNSIEHLPAKYLKAEWLQVIEDFTDTETLRSNYETVINSLLFIHITSDTMIQSRIGSKA